MSLPRSEQNPQDCWKLESIYASAEEWETDLARLKARIGELAAFKGRLAEGKSTLLACLDRLYELERLDEKVGTWAFLKLSEDGSDSLRQGRQGRYTSVSVELQTAGSWFQPELMALPEAQVTGWLDDPALAEYRIALARQLRWRPHTLSQGEERLLALGEEAAQTARKSFGALTDVDLDFGSLDTPDGPRPLTQSSFIAFMQAPDRALREAAWKQFYGCFDQHKNTLASLYQGSLHQDVYRARARNFPSSLEAALFPDQVPQAVYQNLAATVREFLPVLHRYYRLRQERLGLAETCLWDVRAKLFPAVQTHTSFDQAVATIMEALKPLGPEYCATLLQGLEGGWVDRYENKGKRSGAFSAGGFDTQPFILMNYKDTVLGDVFTLAHEAGHSMHSWYSARHNPFPHYHYSIFEAEVASTFNEELLFRHLMARSTTPELRLHLANKHIEDIVATIFRQTMFAEFELACHRRAEAGQSLSLDDLRLEYRRLLEAYFGPGVQLHPLGDLEGLRIPHFYRAFYVYKYATGLSAAMALARQVSEGGSSDRDRYLAFLKSGGSRYPIDNLRLAGVDMARPEPIRQALEVFAGLVDQLETGCRQLSGQS